VGIQRESPFLYELSEVFLAGEYQEGFGGKKMMDKAEWLSSLKAGDKVKVVSGFSGFRISKIERVTNNYFFVDNQIFKRKNGDKAGERVRWNHPYISQITENDVLELNKNKLKKLFELTFNELSAEEVSQLIILLEGEHGSAKQKVQEAKK
jgi:hypothetical protein